MEEKIEPQWRKVGLSIRCIENLTADGHLRPTRKKRTVKLEATVQMLKATVQMMIETSWKN